MEALFLLLWGKSEKQQVAKHEMVSGLVLHPRSGLSTNLRAQCCQSWLASVLLLSRHHLQQQWIITLNYKYISCEPSLSKCLIYTPSGHGSRVCPWSSKEVMAAETLLQLFPCLIWGSKDKRCCVLFRFERSLRQIWGCTQNKYSLWWCVKCEALKGVLAWKSPSARWEIKPWRFYSKSRATICSWLISMTYITTRGSIRKWKEAQT